MRGTVKVIIRIFILIILIILVKRVISVLVACEAELCADGLFHLLIRFRSALLPVRSATRAASDCKSGVSIMRWRQDVLSARLFRSENYHIGRQVLDILYSSGDVSVGIRETCDPVLEQVPLVIERAETSLLRLNENKHRDIEHLTQVNRLITR